MKLLIIAAFLFSTAYGQKKDSLPPNGTGVPAATIKADSATVLMNEFLIFLQDKITVKDYLPVSNYVQAFLKQKEFDKPKKK